MIQVKKCIRCKKTKQFIDFNKDNGGRYRLCKHCRICQREVAKIYRLKNEDSLRRYKREYYFENKSKIQAYVRKRRKNNNLLAATWRKDNKEWTKKYNDEYYKKHRGQILLTRNSILNYEDIPEGLIKVRELLIQLRKDVQNVGNNQI